MKYFEGPTPAREISEATKARIQSEAGASVRAGKAAESRQVGQNVDSMFRELARACQEYILRPNADRAKRKDALKAELESKLHELEALGETTLAREVRRNLDTVQELMDKLE